MQLFRRLASNLFFKIILGFVALSFVLFGISGFILGSPNLWIAKIGNSTISSNAFNKALRADRDIVLASNKSKEATEYVESESFKSDVLGRMVNKIMIEKLGADFAISANKKIILSAIAKDPSFKNKDGKFDHDKFKNFLTNNGLNEERYVNEIASDVTSVMVLQTLSIAAPISDFEIAQIENFKQEKRVADMVTISEKNVTNLARPSKEEIEKFYAENKQGYNLPEMRKVSYIQFSKKDFSKDFALSDQDILAEYEKNKSQMMQPESRNFYHLLFEKDEEAKSFVEKLKQVAGSDKSKLKTEFVKLAKELKHKDQKAITLNEITERDLIPQLAEVSFKLTMEQVSEATQSPLGFHVFLLTGIKPSQALSFAAAKDSLKKTMLKDREDKILQGKVSAIDDMLLTSNSLAEVAKKFNLKINSSADFDVSGQNEKSQQIPENASLEHFAENAFALKENQTSKIFYAKNSVGFYAIKLEKIILSRERKLVEVESQIVADLLKTKKVKTLKDLAKKIADEIKANPNSAADIASKYHASFEKNHEFARYLYVTVKERQMAYQSKFLEALFDLKLNQATSAILQQDQSFSIAILRQIKKKDVSGMQSVEQRTKAAEELRTEIMSEYNSYLLKRYPVKVNEKISAKKEEK